MNAMEMRKKQKRREARKDTVLCSLGMIGVCLIMAGAVGLFHGFHPVTFSMVTVGLMLIEGVLLWDRKEKK